MRKLFADLAMPQAGRTYDEWQAEGYHVRRGETATGRNAHGIPTFTEAQVEENNDDGFDPNINDRNGHW